MRTGYPNYHFLNEFMGQMFDISKYFIILRHLNLGIMYSCIINLDVL